MLLNLAAVANSDNPAVLWGFLRRYAPSATPETHPRLDKLVHYAVAYFRDFVAPKKRYRAADAVERGALEAVSAKLAALPPETTAEDIQHALYDIARPIPRYQDLNAKGATPERPGVSSEFFAMLYAVLLGEERGPRFGSFVALYGVEETRTLIAKALAGEFLASLDRRASRGERNSAIIAQLGLCRDAQIRRRAMLFRQLFDAASSTYSYLIAARLGGEALIIDPVLEKVDRYVTLLNDLDLRLVKAIDTHLHADHVTGLGALRDRTRCVTVMGEMTTADVVSMRVAEGDVIEIDGARLDVLYTPGHTDNSYSFVMPDRVFSGDTLLIRGTGRTDFQNGDPRAQYDSIFGKLLKLPETTLLYPAHDYKGDTVSTIGEERARNPRLQVRSIDEYVDLMNNLKLPNPKLMDVAVPANRHIGLAQDRADHIGFAPGEARAILAAGGALLVDLREPAERARRAIPESSVHAPYRELADALAEGGLLTTLARATGKRLLFICAYGERSAMAVEAARVAGFHDAVHVVGGLNAWVGQTTFSPSTGS